MKKKTTLVLLLCSLLLVFVLSVSQKIPEKNQLQKPVCENCGSEKLETIEVNNYEVGPTSETCVHGYPYGDDLVYKQYTTYQYKCSNCKCEYKSSTRTEESGSRAKCHGYY